MIIKIAITLFALFIFSRLVLRMRDGELTVKGFILWTLLWIGIVIATFAPQTTDVLAQYVGIERGADALLFAAVVFLLYGLFRVGVKLEHLEYEVTQIVRTHALENDKQQPQPTNAEHENTVQ